ncbi:retrovirus-related pol polyprotein from transposon TNT 1-94 [Tanacetum coccineum]|uniref:Retrovirus-related pol polyprotein from transposon TNT 1-94 n=1 Tax=Tanacetum coccineum TaxID=301880 RepID=A0ABQ5BAZ0_9ASTR
MLNTNKNLQTQTSNALHNDIMEAGGKDHPPMLAPEGSLETTIEGYIENYKNVSQDIRNQLDAKAEAVQIILTGIDNDIYSTVDACSNVCEMWKTVESLKQVYHPQNCPTHYTQNFSTKTQQAATRNRGKESFNSPPPTYDQEPEMVAKDDALSKEKEIDKLMALISLSFKKIYKPTNNNLRTSSNTSRANQDNTPRINRGTVDDTDDEPKDQELEAHYLYMAQILEITLNVDNSGPIFDVEPLQKVKNNDDNYNVFANDRDHHAQPEYVNDTYPDEQGDTNTTTDSLDTSNNRGEADQDEDEDLAKERDLLASLIEKLKCEIDESKDRNKLLESSNKTLVDKFEKFKNLKKFQAKLDRYHNVNYASKVEIDYAKAKGELISYKMSSKKSFNEYTRKIIDLNQTISEMKKELFAHQETISIRSQEKEAQKKFHKTREDKELEKVIALENKIKVLEDIVYKTGQLVQTMNMLNCNCKTSFVKLEFLKKAQRANPRLYDIGCYNDNLALMLAPEYDETILLAQESRSKLSDLIKHFDYKNLNNLYALFVPQQEKSPEQRYFSERSKMSHTPIKNENSKESFNKQTTLLEKWMDESILWDHNTVAAKSTNQKPRSKIRKQYEQISKTCKWWYSKITPPRYEWKPKSSTVNVKANTSTPLGIKTRTTNTSKPMTLRKSTVSNTPSSSNSFVARRDNSVYRRLWVLKAHDGKSQASKVYYVEGMDHNLLSVGQFCDADLEVAFQKSTCYIRDLKGNDLLTGSHGTDLYSITLQDISTPNPVCLMAKASSLQAWLWHRRLSHINFDTINLLSKYDIVTGLPKLKFIKDHLCSSCELGKAKRKFFKTKTTPSSKRRLQILHIDLCGPMRVESFNDGENLNKMKEKGNACIFIGYSTQSRAYKVYNKRTRVIVETIHVNFDELPQMASDHVSSDVVPQCPTTALEQDSLSPSPQSQENVPQAAKTVTMSNELDLLFSLMFDELLNGTTQVVSKSSDVTTADAPNQRQQQHTTPSTSITVVADTPPLNIQTTPVTTSQAPSQAPTVTATKNINQAETQKENA